MSAATRTQKHTPRVGVCVDHESLDDLSLLLSGILGIGELGGPNKEANATESLCGPDCL